MLTSHPWRLILACALLALASPALAARPSARAEPPQVVLGTGAQITLTVHTDGQSEKLESLTTAGSLSPREILSAGEARYHWSPPPTKFPQTALVLFWVPRAGEAPDIEVVRLVLIGRTDLQVDTSPQTEVRVEVADKLFGPVLANRQGKATVLLEVPPGVTRARVLGQTGGRSTSIIVPLTPPPVNPLGLLLSPNPLPPGQRAWMWILHTHKLDPARLVLSVQGGRATRERVEPDRALYALDPAPGATAMTATASLRGEPAARVQGSISLTAPPKQVERPKPEDHPKVGITPPPRSGNPGLPGRLSPTVLGGVFIGGAANHGPDLAVGLGYRLPFPGERLFAEVELGLRSQSVSIPVAGEGTLQSSVLVIPVEVAVRGRLIELGRWSLDVRLGGGLLPFRQQVSTDFQSGFTEAGLGTEAFAAAQVAFKLPPLELFLELRGALSQAMNGELNALPGGLIVAIGARCAPR